MKFQVHSDIHLEKYPNRRIKPKSPNLILAGDVGVPIFSSYKTFFRETSSEFDRIIYVLGNHEYERCWMGIDKNNFAILEQKFKERNLLIKDILSQFQNITILDNQMIQIEGKTIYGSTLWTNYYEKKMNKKNNTPITEVQRFLSLQNRLSYSGLNTYPEQIPDILITHYVSNRRVLKKPWSIGLGPTSILPSHLLSIFGHIHYPIDDVYEGQRIICNPWDEESTLKEKVVYLD